MRPDSVPLRAARLVTGLLVAFSLAVPVHGAGHTMSMVGSVAGSPGEAVHAGHGGGGGAAGHAAHQEVLPQSEGSEAPAPLCLCCPGPCACPPALALRSTGERYAPLPSASVRSTIRQAVQAPVRGPIPHERPWPTAPPVLRG